MLTNFWLVCVSFYSLCFQVFSFTLIAREAGLPRNTLLFGSIYHEQSFEMPSSTIEVAHSSFMNFMFSSTAVIMMMTPIHALAAATTLRPSKQDIASIFNDFELGDEMDLPKSDFRRMDESSDSVFYSSPRFVEHIDQNAINNLINFHSSELKIISNRLYGDYQPLDILDLCSSWVAHLPIDTYQGKESSSSVLGVGMNEEELRRNRQLTDWIVQDLNQQPEMKSISSNSFDVALCQLSIDYLTKPVAVMKEAARILRPNGEIIVSFSNRVFFDKAIAGWTGKSDLDHIERVGEYILLSRGFEKDSLRAYSLVSRPDSDPLYIVTAKKGL